MIKKIRNEFMVQLEPFKNASLHTTVKMTQRNELKCNTEVNPLFYSVWQYRQMT